MISNRRGYHHFDIYGLPRRIITYLVIFNDQFLEKKIEIKALWDTGAENCIINTRLIDELKIESEDKETVISANGESVLAKKYQVSLDLSGFDSGSKMLAHQKLNNSKFDLIIGLNVISRGKLSINPSAINNSPTLTFEIIQ
jgi:predicted aspartyl protease